MMKWFSVSEGKIQQLLTWNFIGICASGPLSDTFGRKKPILTALGLFLLGSILTLFAQTFPQMLGGRILQGVGSGGCFTLGTAIIFDAFKKERAVAALNKLNTAIPLIMAAAPMLGGYLNYNFGFRSNFLAIALFVLVSLVICLFMLQETLVVEKRAPFNGIHMIQDFKRALLCLPFWQITLATSAIFGGYMAFLSVSSVLFVIELGMNPALFPFVQAIILGGWVIGSLTTHRLIQRWGTSPVKQAGLFLCGGGGMILALMTWACPENPYLLTSGMVLYALGANWIIGLYFPEGMELLSDIKGIAASLLTSVRLMTAAFIVSFSGYLYNGTIYPLTAVILSTIVILLVLLRSYEKNRPASDSTCSMNDYLNH